MKGEWAARRLVEAAEIKAHNTVLEIGPGTGVLTRHLLTVSDNVIAIEKDSVLVNGLRSKFKEEVGRGALTLIEADIRDSDPERLGLKNGAYVLAANIPYYITGEIIRKFLTADMQPRTIALLVQKEVADRIVARDGKESILSLSVKAYGTPRIVAKVSRGNFSPPPSVDSAILAIENISREFFNDIDEFVFFKIVRAGFSSKRKLLVNNLAAHAKKDAVAKALEKCGVEASARAEDVPLRKWRCLAGQLSGVSFQVSDKSKKLKAGS